MVTNIYFFSMDGRAAQEHKASANTRSKKEGCDGDRGMDTDDEEDEEEDQKNGEDDSSEGSPRYLYMYN